MNTVATVATVAYIPVLARTGPSRTTVLVATAAVPAASHAVLRRYRWSTLGDRCRSAYNVNRLIPTTRLYTGGGPLAADAILRNRLLALHTAVWMLSVSADALSSPACYYATLPRDRFRLRDHNPYNCTLDNLEICGRRSATPCVAQPRSSTVTAVTMPHTDLLTPQHDLPQPLHTTETTTDDVASEPTGIATIDEILALLRDATATSPSTTPPQP